MRNIHSFILALGLAALSAPVIDAEKLIIIHTNDTHSQIDPNDKGFGGVSRRKVLIDSVRANNRNTFLVDAGDAVQGTLYFNRFKGEVEYKMLDLLGYDMAILGNHDFDNGPENLAQLLKKSKTDWVSTNYDFSNGPLDGIFKPYLIREYDGRKVGFIGLNLRPKGMIAEGNYDGVEYLDAIEAANATAWHLKHNEKVDLVVAVSHLGYSGTPAPKDIDVARESRNIDIIIGGHSHTYLSPDDTLKTRLRNADGREVLVAQVGKQGQNIGVITVDLDNMSSGYSTISVDSRLDSRINKDFADVITPYRDSLEEMMRIPLAETAVKLENTEPGLINFVADFGFDMGKKLSGKPVDVAIMNKGSIRQSLPEGEVSLGMILMMQPFNNYLVVLDLKGKDLLDAFDVMAVRGGDSVSGNVDATMKDGKCVSVLIDGKKIDPERTYRVLTIDYLANGGDYMEPLTRGTVIARSNQVVNKDMIEYLSNDMKGKKINPSTKKRMHY